MSWEAEHFAVLSSYSASDPCSPDLQARKFGNADCCHFFHTVIFSVSLLHLFLISSFLVTFNVFLYYLLICVACHC